MPKLFSAWVCLLAVALTSGVANAQEPAEVPYIDKMSHIHYLVDDQGRVTETVTSRYQVRQQQLLERVKVYSISFSTSIESGEILEAYTLKKDGRQVPAPPGNFQRQTNDGRAGGGPAFSDYTRLSVILPDLDVGDTVHVKYRKTAREAIFPGQFSLAMSLSPFMPYEDVRIVLDAPRAMKLANEAHHVQVLQPAQPAGRQVFEWRYQNPKPRTYDREKEGGVWSLSEVPSVLVSTFPDYEAITRAYGDRALPKAQPTARVRELVRTVLGTETRPREKARLLYEWVSSNITYAGNCIGVGAVVPRDQEFVLDNRMGDCKDHATLLQAMLAAADIRSEQVLINSGGSYELAKVPVVSLVNHVMNYLPDFKLYVDATAKDIPFGYLPTSAYEKPVLHVGAEKALARIPAGSHTESEQRVHAVMRLTESGGATGTLKMSLKGLAAQTARTAHRELSKDEEREYVKDALSSYNLRGKGALVKGDTRGFGDTYEYSISFDVSNFLRGRTGSFVFAPVVPSPYPVFAFSEADEKHVGTRPTPCYGFRSFETYELELPADLKVLSMPTDAEVKGSLVDYSASYQRAGNLLKVKREVHDKTPAGLCSPETMREFTKQSAPVADNLRTQLMYRRGE